MNETKPNKIRAYDIVFDSRAYDIEKLRDYVLDDKHRAALYKYADDADYNYLIRAVRQNSRHIIDDALSRYLGPNCTCTPLASIISAVLYDRYPWLEDRFEFSESFMYDNQDLDSDVFLGVIAEKYLPWSNSPKHLSRDEIDRILENELRLVLPDGYIDELKEFGPLVGEVSLQV